MPNRNQRRSRSRSDYNNFPVVRRVFRAVDDVDRIHRPLIDILSKQVAATNAFELPLKSTRIEQLLDAKFNCADFGYWMRGKLIKDELRKLFEKYGKVSIRTFTEENYDQPTPRLPVSYGVGRWESVLTWCLQHNQEYHTLVNEYLKLEESLYTGNLIMLGGDKYIASVIEGCGTPRDADVPGADVSVFLGSFDDQVPNIPPFIPEVAYRFRNFLPELRPITVEFSYYPFPVGLLKQQEVFWEWRGGSAQDLVTVIAHLIPQARSFESHIKI